ncbi:hypothetical protein V1477_018787 [Vespula maculifrons]|uniref:Uncharacterized protein n=1 Tax=Vespula maculifrons TaxID=7453 RepID=A0ABD2AX19_VESMC
MIIIRILFYVIFHNIKKSIIFRLLYWSITVIMFCSMSILLIKIIFLHIQRGAANITLNLLHLVTSIHFLLCYNFISDSSFLYTLYYPGQNIPNKIHHRYFKNSQIYYSFLYILFENNYLQNIKTKTCINNEKMLITGINNNAIQELKFRDIRCIYFLWEKFIFYYMKYYIYHFLVTTNYKYRRKKKKKNKLTCSRINDKGAKLSNVLVEKYFKTVFPI